MKIRKITQKVIVSALALTLTFSSFMPAMEVQAANYSAQSVTTQKIIANGVRLRKEGHANGTVLELMYKGDSITYYSHILGSDPEYNYMRREKTKTYGYVHHDFVNV